MNTSRTRRFTIRRAVLGMVVLVAALLPTVTHASIDSLYVIPPQPTIMDSVSVRVVGSFPNGCYRRTPMYCGTVADFSINMRVDAIFFRDSSSFCPPNIVTYAGTCEYGRLPVGSYQAVFTETVTSSQFPIPLEEKRTVTFMVIGPTPVRTMTWGRLKMLYR